MNSHCDHGRRGLVGEFAPPHDPVTMYNHGLARQLCVDDDDRAEIGQISSDGLVTFAVRIGQLLRRVERLTYATRAFDRPSLLHLFVALRIARFLGRPVDLVVHSELFAFLGPLRSRHVGKPLLRWCLRNAASVTCGDQATAAALRDASDGHTDIEVVDHSVTVDGPLFDPYIDVSLRPTIIVSCNAQSLSLISVADRIRRSLNADHRLVIAAYGLATNDDIAHQLDDGDLVVSDPDVDQAAALFAASTLSVRPVRCMGAVRFADDWAMLEQPRVDVAPDAGERDPWHSHQYQLDLSDGVVVVRRPTPSTDAPTLNDGVIADLVADAATSVLFVGVVTGVSDEAGTNRQLVAALSRQLADVETISLADAGIDGETFESYRRFAVTMWRRVKHHDTVFYATQGTTRPSLLQLLTTAVISALQRRRLSLLIHPQLFDFFGRLRSRNAGLPLLLTTFSICRHIYGTPAACATARDYMRDDRRLRPVAFGPAASSSTTRAPDYTRLLIDAASPPRVVVEPLTCDAIELAPLETAHWIVSSIDDRSGERALLIAKGGYRLGEALDDLAIASSPARTRS